MEGGGLVLVGFVGAFAFSLIRSRERLKTALYSVGAILFGTLCFVVAGYFSKLNGEVVGEIGVDVGLLCGILAALVHSRRSRVETTPSTSRKSEGQP